MSAPASWARTEHAAPPANGKAQEPANDAPTDPLEAHWVRLSEHPDLLIETPPKQTWLLDRANGARSVGVLSRAKAGLLTGTGGVSKTYALVQLGVAVASAGFWLDTFRVVTSGHVLLALGEEDLDEARRRLWRACNAAELTPEQRRAVAQNIDLLPLHGVPVALSHSTSPGVVVATEMASVLRRRLEERGVDWALVVIEPLSRWAGGGVEADNEAATRFVQIVETFTSVRGNPTVLLAHHSSKFSAQAGNSDARGVTGIRDGFRWMATLDGLKSEDGRRAVRLRNSKTNYSPEFDDLLLVRNDEPGKDGTLRLATKNEAEGFDAAQGGRPTVTDEELGNRLLATLSRMKRARIKRDLVEATEGDDGKLYKALSKLISNGSVVREEDGWFALAVETSAVNDDVAE